MKTHRVFFYLLIGILFPFIVSGHEVGVLPFENQRNNAQQNWLGYYMQYRLESGLSQQPGLTIKPLSWLRLWRFNIESAQKTPHPESTSRKFHIISGSYQKVFNMMYVHLTLKDSHGNMLATEETDFLLMDVNERLDQMLMRLYHTIGKKLELKRTEDFTFSNEISPFFNLRHFLFAPDVKVSSDLFYTAKLRLKQYPVTAFRQDLIESLIIFSRLKVEKGGARYLDLAESWTRKFLKKDEKNVRLKGFLAEIFYFKEAGKSFVRKLSETAINNDPNFDLPYLLMCLINGIATDESEEYLKRLEQINPWIIPKDRSETVQFQHGILTDHIIKSVNSNR